MSQPPMPPSSYGNPPIPYAPQPGPPRTNGWAVGSLICGLLGCIPVVTSLAAIVLGFLGIGKSKQPNTGGKGLAIAGLILGILGLIGWGVGGYMGYQTYRYAQTALITPTQQASSAFINSLASGDISTAQNLTTGNMSAAQLQGLAAEISAYGGFQDFSLNSFDADASPGGVLRIRLGGIVNFQNASKSFRADLVGTMGGQFKIENFNLE